MAARKVQVEALDLEGTGWTLTSETETLEKELRRELSPNHVLFNQLFVLIARREDQDDILLALDGDIPFAGVHLTWNKENNPEWPSTWFYPDLQSLMDEYKTS